jgi:hypothetical protein
MEDQQQLPVKPIVDEYKGNKILVLNPGSKFPFSFGLAKAKLILQHLDAIRQFIQEHDKKP